MLRLFTLLLSVENLKMNLNMYSRLSSPREYFYGLFMKSSILFYMRKLGASILYITYPLVETTTFLKLRLQHIHIVFIALILFSLLLPINHKILIQYGEFSKRNLLPVVLWTYMYLWQMLSTVFFFLLYDDAVRFQMKFPEDIYNSHVNNRYREYNCYLF